MANFKPILPEKFSASDISIVCRICLLPKQILYSIFDHDIDKLLLAIVRFPVAKNDGHPHQICSKCYKDIVTAYRFKKQCEYAYNVVKSVLKTPLICCNVCPANFCSNSNLKRHLRNIHDVKWEIGTPLPDISDSVRSIDFPEECNTENSAKQHREGNCNNNEQDERLFLDSTDETNFNEHFGIITLNPLSRFSKSEMKETKNLTSFETNDKNSKDDNCFTPIKKPNFKELIFSEIDKNKGNIQILSYLDLMPKDKRIEYENFIEKKKVARQVAYKILKKISRRSLKSSFLKSKSYAKFNECEKYECFECKKKYGNIDDLRRHQLTHSDDQKLHACGICSKLFSHSDYLNYHLKKFHISTNIERPYQCFICKKLHTNGVDLSDHLIVCKVGRMITNQTVFPTNPRYEEGASEYKIDYNEAANFFSNSTEYNFHQTDMGSNKFNYQDFNSKLYYNTTKHTANHHNESPHNIEESHFKSNFVNDSIQSSEKTRSKEFLKNLLSEHAIDSELMTKKIQDMERNVNGKFECELCQKEFNRKAHVRRHYLTHTTAKPYVCKFCGSKFSCAEYVQTHMNRVHLDKISIIPNSIEIKTELNQNNSDRTNNFQFDNSCKANYFKTYSNKNPINFPYTVKHEIVPKRRILKNDVLKTPDGKFQCKVCQKLFNRAEHVRRHELIHSSFPKPFKCKYCAKEFSRPDNLKKHFSSCCVRNTILETTISKSVPIYSCVNL